MIEKWKDNKRKREEKVSREIKFRAWDKSEKRMLPVNRIDFSDRTFRTGLFSSEFYDYSDDYILEQFTGLHDNKRTEEYPNGQPIYEGDICIGKRGGEPYEFTVKWDELDARFLGYTNSGYRCYVGQEPCVEVIGNIHEKEI